MWFQDCAPLLAMPHALPLILLLAALFAKMPMQYLIYMYKSAQVFPLLNYKNASMDTSAMAELEQALPAQVICIGDHLECTSPCAHCTSANLCTSIPII